MQISAAYIHICWHLDLNRLIWIYHIYHRNSFSAVHLIQFESLWEITAVNFKYCSQIYTVTTPEEHCRLLSPCLITIKLSSESYAEIWTCCAFCYSSAAAVWHHEEVLLRQHQSKTHKHFNFIIYICIGCCHFLAAVSLGWEMTFISTADSCPSKSVFFYVYHYAGLADWNPWVCKEGCGHHVAW